MKKSTPTAPSAMREPSRHRYDWTEQSEARLIELIEKERVTAARAAAILNKEFPCFVTLTRSAVATKIQRIWKGREND